jgi:ssDNA-binding Zn-finger/Zn-ribbon topoisomerase 1
VVDGAPQPSDHCPCGGTWIRRENSDTHGRFWGCSNYPRCENTRDEVMRARLGPYWQEIERPELAKCSNGHPRTPQNTAYNAAGYRVCLDCKGFSPATSRTVAAKSPVPPTRSAATSSVGTCRNGHPRTPENTYVRPNGERECRICRQLARRR